MRKSVVPFLLATVFVACNNPEKQAASADAKDSVRITKDGPSPIHNVGDTLQKNERYQPETTNAATAEKLQVFLRDYLKDDLALLAPDDRNFSFYGKNMDSDDKPEYFIRLDGNYFCGSGGCTFLLLDDDLRLVNRFTVMSGPVFISPKATGGWNDVILKGKNENSYVHLKFDAKTAKYPSNPSLVIESKEAPSSQDYAMWQDDYEAKDFTF